MALKGEELALQSKEISWDVWGEGALTAAGPVRSDAVADPAQRERAVLAIVGEGEYVVYTSRQLRSKAFGEGTDFVWRPNSNAYCVQIVRLK